MTTTAAQIDLWRQSPSERQHLEFKEAKAQFDNRKLYEYCVALANEGGGYLLLGIADKPPRPVVGTRAFADPVAMAEKLFQAIGFRVDIEEVAHPDGRVLVRHGLSSRRCVPDALRRSHGADERGPVTPHFCRGRAGLAGGAHEDRPRCPSGGGMAGHADLLRTIEAALPDEPRVIDRLVRERLIDERGGPYAIRRLGALLLAKGLDEFSDLARKAARVVVYTGASKLDTRLDQTGAKGYAVGFQRLVRFVMGQLPQNEVIEDALRKEVKLVPEVVIRELVANALIHQDFMISGASVMVEVYSNRVEISNPGEPVVPVERFIDGYQSRNERLADLMRRMGICEEKSSGIDRVVQAAEVYQLPAPDFRAGHQRTVVTIYGPRPFEDMDRNDRTRACYQHCVLKWVMSERMTNQSLRERFHLPESKAAIASQVIAATIETGLIKPDETVGGSRKFARYLPFWA